MIGRAWLLVLDRLKIIDLSWYEGTRREEVASRARARAVLSGDLLDDAYTRGGD